jgi:hypothetical protein
MEELLIKRIIDMTGQEFVALQLFANAQTLEKPDYVGKAEKDKILGCRATKTSTAAGVRLTWGKQQRPPIKVRKAGGSLWNRKDLEILFFEYTKANL